MQAIKNHPFENHPHWSAVQSVSATLQKAGHATLLAGGCVRDLILHRTPNDFDIATDATPDEAARLFPNALTVGKAFGVTIVPFSGFQIEVATFREDLEYRDGRRPEGVKFSTPEADAKRRDFTVNALFYDLAAKRILDFVDGEADIHRKLIRTVGNPDQRFGEDKLRLLRAVRFSAQLGFSIDPETWKSIQTHASQVSQMSRERIKDELVKLLKSSGRTQGLRLLAESGLLREAFPDVAEQVSDGEFEIWLSRFSTSASESLDLTTWLALFYFPVSVSGGEKKTREALKSLKLDNRQIDRVVFGLKQAPRLLDPHSMARKGEWIELLLPHRANDQSTDDVLALAEIFAHTPPRGVKIDPTWKTQVTDVREKIKSGKILSEPFLNGADLAQAGLKPGPDMGKILRELFLLQLEEKIHSRDEALTALKGMN